MRIAFFVLFLLSHSFVSASSLDFFHKRFKFERKDGNLLIVRDTTLSAKFSINPFLKQVREMIIQEQELMNSKTDYDYELKSLFAEGSTQSLTELDNSDIELVINSMKELRSLDIDQIFKNDIFKDFIQKFELKLKDVLLMADPTIVANVSDPTYFYKKHVTGQVLTWGLNLAKKTFSQVPFLNTASFVLTKVTKMFLEKRHYHQNMLLHYLEKFEAKDLGITHSEANQIFSSIYESRIAWFAFWESAAAKADWEHYGTNKFFQSIRAVNTKFRSTRGQYDSVGKRLNYAFIEANYKGRDVVLNLFDSQNMISSKPSIALDLNSPAKIKRLRAVLHLAQLGVSFISLPDFIKSMAQNFMKSFYEKQQITEGALQAYLESNGLVNQSSVLRSQYLNPFDSLSNF